jgi:environmental stress-induced protein Ves
LNRTTLIRADEIPAQPWRNGGGQTRELMTWPAGVPSWQLRISLAQVASAGSFSIYPGIERWFSVIDGAGVCLSLNGADRPLRPGHEPLQFNGAVPVFCTLIDGPTTDLNLMHAGGRAAMVRAESGVAWSSDWPQRGIFARTAGVWSAQHAEPVRLARHCLLWIEESAETSWTFTAADPAAPAPALWLGFDPSPR